MRLAERKIYKGKVLCINKKTILIYRKGSIYLLDENNKNRIKLMTLSGVKNILSKIRIFERLLRLEPRCAVPGKADGTYLVSWNGKLLLLDTSKKNIQIVMNYRQGMNNPLALQKVCDLQGFDDGFYFGEYFGNSNREKVCIYRIENETVHKMYSFPENSILHIHGCVPDYFHNRLLILTGDNDSESGIWEVKDNFNIIQPLICGSQQFRACVAFANEDGIVYATDTPLEDNAIYHYSNETCKVEKIYDMPGPCIYGRSIKLKDGKDVYFFVTSVEPDSSLSRWRYILTYKLGKGVKKRKSCIVVGNIERGFEVIHEIHKDILPMLLFQFGNIQFPYSDMVEEIYLTMTALSKYDGKTACYKLYDE